MPCRLEKLAFFLSDISLVCSIFVAKTKKKKKNLGNEFIKSDEFLLTVQSF